MFVIFHFFVEYFIHLVMHAYVCTATSQAVHMLTGPEAVVLSSAQCGDLPRMGIASAAASGTVSDCRLHLVIRGEGP